MSWSAQVDAVVNKANNVLSTDYRTLESTNQEAFSTLYKALVRPLLEYAALVWCPCLVKDILALEKVQRLGEYHASCLEYDERLKILNWPTLGKQRHFISLVEFYKTILVLNNLKLSDFFEFTRDNRTRANHPFN